MLVEEMNVENRKNFFLERFESIHFARWVILEEKKDLYGNTIFPSLVFSSNFDGTIKSHLNDLVSIAVADLEKIGLAKDVKLPRKKSITKRLVKNQEQATA